MIQQIIVGVLFLIAVFYIYKTFKKQIKSGEGGCGSANCKCEPDAKAKSKAD